MCRQALSSAVRSVSSRCVFYIGVGRFRILGGPRFRILGGPRGAKLPAGT